ncbi:hypothetical protein [Natrinema longum]|uniref:hypothetical protein n=1 Tax=Natrinema longum TaxID=370324 RepID=UPI001CCC91F9|nr:hypothetical protein [Natrinema longum]MBZ6497098.1 hypothetical protein [Natrinema longum]
MIETGRGVPKLADLGEQLHRIERPFSERRAIAADEQRGELECRHRTTCFSQTGGEGKRTVVFVVPDEQDPIALLGLPDLTARLGRRERDPNRFFILALDRDDRCLSLAECVAQGIGVLSERHRPAALSAVMVQPRPGHPPESIAFAGLDAVLGLEVPVGQLRPELVRLPGLHIVAEEECCEVLFDSPSRDSACPRVEE